MRGIAAGGERQVYRSVAEVPASLRKILQDSTSSANSATILIADRRGKEEIARAEFVRLEDLQNELGLPTKP